MQWCLENSRSFFFFLVRMARCLERPSLVCSFGWWQSCDRCEWNLNLLKYVLAKGWMHVSCDTGIVSRAKAFSRDFMR
jgi:hypothetical protein